MLKTSDIAKIFIEKYAAKEFSTDKSGVKTVEILGASFLADEPCIFGEPNDDYIKRELAWYDLRSLFVGDIPPPIPKIWKDVSSPFDGRINSNYGYLVHSKENGSQYSRVLNELLRCEGSRRACMIYTRPSMHVDATVDGMNDFVCTNAVQYFIRDRRMHAVVQMRSNDVVFGYRNDVAWQRHVLQRLCEDYNAYDEFDTYPGDIIWQVGSLHVYERHFNLIK